MKKQTKSESTHTSRLAFYQTRLLLAFVGKEKASCRSPASTPSLRLYLLVPGIQVEELLPAGHVNQALEVRCSLLKQLGQVPGRLGFWALERFHIPGVVPRAQLPAAVSRGGPRGQEWRGHVSLPSANLCVAPSSLGRG